MRTLLDSVRSFSVLTKDLLNMQRSMQTLFTPRVEKGVSTAADPNLAKTMFQVSEFLPILEKLSMHRTMLGS